ncbi:MAG: lectin-like protein [Acutalibacteraceae bacterium]
MNNQQKSKSIAKRTTAFLAAVLMAFTLVPFSMFSASAASLKIPSGAEYYGGHMYYVYKNDVTWKKAKKLCEEKGGHLATITSKGESDFVTELVQDKDIGYCWLGATDEAKEGTWKWITGEKFKYKNWCYGQPDGPDDEHFLGTYHNYEWNDFRNDADDVNGYVCEWEVGRTNGIKQVSASSSSITLSWKDNDRISSYIIYYYDTSAKKYIKYKTVTKTSITISGLSSATTYKIAISSVFKNNGKTQVAPKTTFNAVTRPGTTKNLKIEDKISLTWSKVKGADGYVVYLYNSDRKRWETFDVVTKNSCKIGKKFGSESQQYKVRAYKKSTDGTKFYGGYSNTVKR